MHNGVLGLATSNAYLQWKFCQSQHWVYPRVVCKLGKLIHIGVNAPIIAIPPPTVMFSAHGISFHAINGPP